MDATLAIMAARPLNCALPEGRMATLQRVREVAAVARDGKTRLFLNRPRTMNKQVLAPDGRVLFKLALVRLQVREGFRPTPGEKGNRRREGKTG